MDARNAIWERLSQVIEPELGLPLTDLGLIYGVELDDTERIATIRMTLTSPMCPMAPEIIAMVQQAVEGVAEVEETRVEVVFDPPWDPLTMASEDALAELGLG